MVRLGKGGTSWLRAVHIVCACNWIGGSLTLVLMQFGMTATGGEELSGIDRSMRFVDDFIIIPGAFGCLITGILFSILTNWGFLKFRWVILKYIINVWAIVFGTFWLGPWLNSMAPISRVEGLGALTHGAYLYFKTMNTWFALAQNTMLLFAVYLSVFKPWSKT